MIRADVHARAAAPHPGVVGRLVDGEGAIRETDGSLIRPAAPIPPELVRRARRYALSLWTFRADGAVLDAVPVVYRGEAVAS